MAAWVYDGGLYEPRQAEAHQNIEHVGSHCVWYCHVSISGKKYWKPCGKLKFEMGIGVAIATCLGTYIRVNRETYGNVRNFIYYWHCHMFHGLPLCMYPYKIYTYCNTSCYPRLHSQFLIIFIYIFSGVPELK